MFALSLPTILCLLQERQLQFHRLKLKSLWYVCSCVRVCVRACVHEIEQAVKVISSCL